MNKKTVLIFFLFYFIATANAQEFAQASLGAGYANQVYYTIATDEVSALPNEVWDLAFTTGGADAGVHLNESAGLSATGLRLYRAPTNNFSDAIDPATLTDSLYNDEQFWENGALNTVRDENDPFDFGWGKYNPANHIIEGTKVFALQLRNGDWKKFMIESLSGGIYSLKYADLDGANENLATIAKADFSSSPLAFFSFETGAAEASPAGWDLLFGRYTTPLDAGGEIIQYTLTGVLSGPGVEVAQANGIDPETVNHEIYLDSFDTRLDVIGFDWKFFDLNTFTWGIETDRAYFVKTAENILWKIVFFDFEGSSTGTSTFEKTEVGVVVAVNDISSNFNDFGLFPNPVKEAFTLSFSLKKNRSHLDLTILNSLGQAVWRTSTQGNEGLNVVTFSAPKLPAGTYFLTAGLKGDVVTSKIIFQ